MCIRDRRERERETDRQTDRQTERDREEEEEEAFPEFTARPLVPLGPITVVHTGDTMWLPCLSDTLTDTDKL